MVHAQRMQTQMMGGSELHGATCRSLDSESTEVMSLALDFQTHGATSHLPWWVWYGLWSIQLPGRPIPHERATAAPGLRRAYVRSASLQGATLPMAGGAYQRAEG